MMLPSNAAHRVFGMQTGDQRETHLPLDWG